MAFNNEDHTNSHKRKHEIDLHLGIDSSTNTTEADQTPTPTRFIRNCEEVGLFQDLQNVNPFEETFRQATELAKTGSLHLPEASSDDSLHTPHIFPHIEEFGSNDNADRDITSSIRDAITKINDKKCKTPDHSALNIISIATLTPAVSNHEDTVKLKLKEALKIRNRSDVERDAREHGSQGVRLENNDRNCVKTIRRVVKSNKSLKLNRLEIKRETNRAAQYRSRERKKHHYRQLANEVILLRSEIKQLSKENQKLKDEVAWLKTMLLYHKDCPVSQDPRVAEEVNSLRKPAQEEKEVNSPPVAKKVVPIHSIPSSFITLAPPLILQVPTQTSSSILASLTPLLPKPQLIATATPSKVVNLPKTSLQHQTLTRNDKLNKGQDKVKRTKRHK